MPDAPPTGSDDPTPAFSRRSALRLGLAGGFSALGAALLPGCVGSVPAVYATRDSPTPTGYADARPILARPAQTAAAPRRVLPTPAPPSGTMRVTPRSAWTSAAVGRNIKPMSGVNRITVHHSATITRGTSAASTISMLESIRESHLARGWADIGYHFAVDPAGRVLACRDLRWQGAHVADHNEHNVGICVLGNFDEQRPTAPQLHTLHTALTSVASAYRVPMRRIYTHQELNPTACPGSSLQHHMVLARRGLA